MTRCIDSKKEIVQFGETRFPGFRSIYPDKVFGNRWCTVLPNGDCAACFPFARKGEEGSFQHMQIERDFREGRIHLRLNEFYLSYFMYSWNAAMATYKVQSNTRYGTISEISPAYAVCSPWFAVENNKQSLQTGLEELAGWYEEHLEEICRSYQKQQIWLGKEFRALRAATSCLGERLLSVTEEEAAQMYETVDRLAKEYKALDIPIGAKLSGFGYFCCGKLPPKFDLWAKEISDVMLSKKGRVTDDPEYAHLFATDALLYLFHDSREQHRPGTLARMKL